MSAEATNRRLITLAVAMLVVVVLGQLLAGALLPSRQGERAQAAVGKAGFAYLGGLRTFAAATLWNRIEPQFHSYYSERMALSEMDFMLPTMNLVVLLDPQFEQAYYISSFIVYQGVSPQQGVSIAQDGVRNNPRSGLLNANLASLLYRQDKQANRDEALRAVEAALAPDAVWSSGSDQFEGYGMALSILKGYGLEQRAAQVAAVQQMIPVEPAENHDHNGDGVPDHDAREHGAAGDDHDHADEHEAE